MLFIYTCFIFDIFIHRYEIRRRNEWDEGDTFYEAWLRRSKTKSPAKEVERKRKCQSENTNPKKLPKIIHTTDDSDTEPDDDDSRIPIDLTKVKKESLGTLFKPNEIINEVIMLSDNDKDTLAESENEVKPILSQIRFKPKIAGGEVIELLDSD